MSVDCEEEVKVKRLYNEIRYARMSSMSLQPTAAVFRLNRNYTNLSSEEYADNLCSYLCSARSCKTITIEDLNNVIHGIAGKEVDTEAVIVQNDMQEVVADAADRSTQQRQEVVPQSTLN